MESLSGQGYVGGMKKLLLASALTALLAAGPTQADAADNVVLIELFTSQGCSSCPPADKNLADMAGREDVLPLSMHVDYWDYLGWRDTFGSRAHTERQYEYRRLMGARVVYTPQMIVQGQMDVPGYQPALIEQAVQRAASKGPAADISIGETSGMLKATITPRHDMGNCTIWVASYDKTAEVEIERGENAGRTITYHNVVDKLMRVGPWQGSVQAIDLPTPAAGEGMAVWLQDNDTGAVMAASFIEN